jgi:hypothetical protein
MSDALIRAYSTATGIKIAEGQARDAALQLQFALREIWRERFGDLRPSSLDLLRHLSLPTVLYSLSRRPWRSGWNATRRKSLAEERAAPFDKIMLAGEQFDFSAVALRPLG